MPAQERREAVSADPDNPLSDPRLVAVMGHVVPLFTSAAAVVVEARVHRAAAHLLLVYICASMGVSAALRGADDSLELSISVEKLEQVLQAPEIPGQGGLGPGRSGASSVPAPASLLRCLGVGGTRRLMIAGAAKMLAALAIYRLPQRPRSLDAAVGRAVRDLFVRHRGLRGRGDAGTCAACSPRGRDVDGVLRRAWLAVAPGGKDDGTTWGFVATMVEDIASAFATDDSGCTASSLRGGRGRPALDVDTACSWVRRAVEGAVAAGGAPQRGFVGFLDKHVGRVLEKASPCGGHPFGRAAGHKRDAQGDDDGRPRTRAATLRIARARSSRKTGASRGPGGRSSRSRSSGSSSEGELPPRVAPDVPRVEALAAKLRDRWMQERSVPVAAGQAQPRREVDTRLFFTSIFSGTGAFILGMEMAGMRVVQTCESDPAAREILQRQWPGADVDHSCADVRDLVLSPRSSCVVMGPPCTDLSSLGRRDGQFGAESGLLADALRAISRAVDAGHGPEWVVVEQVRSALHEGSALGAATSPVRAALGDSGCCGGPSAIQALAAALHSIGYRMVCTRAWSPDVDAGIPVRRQRVILVAARTGNARQVLFRPVPAVPRSSSARAAPAQGPPGTRAWFFTPPPLGRDEPDLEAHVTGRRPSAAARQRGGPRPRRALALDLSTARALPGRDGRHVLPCLTQSNTRIAVIDAARSRCFLVSPEIRERAAGLPAGFTVPGDGAGAAATIGGDATTRTRLLGRTTGSLPMLFIASGIVHHDEHRGPEYASADDPELQEPLGGSHDPAAFAPKACAAAAASGPGDGSWTLPANTWSIAEFAAGSRTEPSAIRRHAASGLHPGGWFGGQPLTPLGRWITAEEAGGCRQPDRQTIEDWGRRLANCAAGVEPEAADALVRRVLAVLASSGAGDAQAEQ